VPLRDHSGCADVSMPVPPGTLSAADRFYGCGHPGRMSGLRKNPTPGTSYLWPTTARDSPLMACYNLGVCRVDSRWGGGLERDLAGTVITGMKHNSSSMIDESLSCRIRRRFSAPQTQKAHQRWAVHRLILDSPQPMPSAWGRRIKQPGLSDRCHFQYSWSLRANARTYCNDLNKLFA